MGSLLLLTSFVYVLYREAQYDFEIRDSSSLPLWKPQEASVLRNGELVTVQAAELVPGDIVELNGPMGIAADLRLVECQEMKVNHLPFTGESVHLSRDQEESTNWSLLEASNVAFAGTLCVVGKARGIVMHTGKSTLLGLLLHRLDEGIASPMTRGFWWIKLSIWSGMAACLALCLFH